MASLVPIVLLFFLGSGNPIELISVIDARDYFQSRGVEVKTDKMIMLATTAPVTAKDQVMQLLAIRVLSTGADKAQPVVKAALADIADGKKGKDPLGFAQQHARAALARSVGERLPSLVPPNSVRAEALQWFPEKCSLFAVLDARHAEDFTPVPGGASMVKSLTAKIPPDAHKKLYDKVDVIGNVRVDRIAFAYQDSAQAGQGRLYLRFTGKADPRRLADLLKEWNPEHQLQERKGKGGEAIRLLNAPGKQPAFALVGDTDLVIAGFDGNNKDHRAVIEEVLETRQEGKSVKDTFAARLRDVPANASLSPCR